MKVRTTSASPLGQLPRGWSLSGVSFGGVMSVTGGGPVRRRPSPAPPPLGAERTRPARRFNRLHVHPQPELRSRLRPDAGNDRPVVRLARDADRLGAPHPQPGNESRRSIGDLSQSSHRPECWIFSAAPTPLRRSSLRGSYGCCTAGSIALALRIHRFGVSPIRLGRRTQGIVRQHNSSPSGGAWQR